MSSFLNICIQIIHKKEIPDFNEDKKKELNSCIKTFVEENIKMLKHKLEFWNDFYE